MMPLLASTSMAVMVMLPALLKPPPLTRWRMSRAPLRMSLASAVADRVTVCQVFQSVVVKVSVLLDGLVMVMWVSPPSLADCSVSVTVTVEEGALLSFTL